MAQSICVQVVPHFGGVLITMSEGRNSKPFQRALSMMSDRYCSVMGPHLPCTLLACQNTTANMRTHAPITRAHDRARQSRGDALDRHVGVSLIRRSRAG